jgi:chorismate synthase
MSVPKGLRFMTAGESHGPALVAILEGMPAGLEIPTEIINRELARRQRGFGAGPRMKIESDRVRVLGGIMEGRTTGAPLAFLIENRDHGKWRGREVAPFTIPRPGHADLTAAIKYGYRDLRPALERASARETAARVAAGAVCKYFLAQFGVQVGGYVLQIGEIKAELDGISYEERIAQAELSEVRCPDQAAAEAMRTRIRQVMDERDTLGGILEIVASDFPAGIGTNSQWDRRLEARLGAAVLSVQAIKGVEIGTAFENAGKTGTMVQDAIRLAGSELVRGSDRAGGIEGGISNGAPIIVRAAMKPIATTLTPQQSVDLASGQEVETQYERSDFCPVPRAVPILEAMVSFVLADALIEKLGGDSMDEMSVRFSALRRARLEDLEQDGTAHVFWPAEDE